MSAPLDKDYVLGTHDDEIERLGLQHRVWRARALDTWRRAGFTVGQTLIDVGCGPGWATLDLAEIVGPTGRVIAIDRSRRFLDALEAAARARDLGNITVVEGELTETDFSAFQADGAWTRWVYAFVPGPREVLARVTAGLRRGGVYAIHEYIDYRTWRLAPRSAVMEKFVEMVVESWRASGGEPDVGMDLPRWMAELGYDVRGVKSIVDIIEPSDFAWQWPKRFLDIGLRRMVEQGSVSAEEAREISSAVTDAEKTPHTWMVLPMVSEIIAARK